MTDKSNLSYQFGPYHLEPEEARLSCHGQEIPLTSTLLKLLTELVKNGPHICRYNDLLSAVWPNVVVEESNITVSVVKLRRIIPKEYIQTVPGFGYRFVEKVTEIVSRTPACRSPFELPDSSLAPPEGALLLTSPFYVERPTDAQFHAAIRRRDSFALVKGARQVGKTSLLARGLEQARNSGVRVVLTDFKKLTVDACSSLEKLLLALAQFIADSLGLAPPASWNERLSATTNFEKYLRSDVLGGIDGQLLWALDEVDRLFSYSYHSDVFGLFRSWHNARALDPDGPWLRLTLALSYATEAHLFISNLNQSPFNVGTRLVLEDFTLAQVMTLNERYGKPLGDADAAEFFKLINGHPYLVHYGLYFMKARNLAWKDFENVADRDDGPFGDHLRHVQESLQADASINQAVHGLTLGEHKLALREFYRLRSGGIVIGNSPGGAKLRCELYEKYLKRQTE